MTIDRNNLPLISASLIIFAETIPLNFIEFPIVATSDQLLYLVAFIISFSPTELVRFLRSKYFKNIFLIYFIYLLIKYIIERYIKIEFEVTFSYIYSISSFILLYIFFRIYRYDQLYKLTRWLLVLILFSSVFGLFNYLFGGYFETIRQLLGGDNEKWLYFGKGDPISGLSKTLFHHAYQIVILPVLFLSLYVYNKKSIYLIFSIFTVLLVILNRERAALGAIIIAGLFLIKYLKIKIKFLPLLLAGILIFTINSFFSEAIKSEDSSITRLAQDDSDFSDRFIKMGSAIITVIKNPLTGGTVMEYERDFYSKTGYYPSSPHNTYINTGRFAGIIGFLLLVLFISKLYGVIRLTLKQLFTPFKNLYLGYISSFIAVLIVGFFHNAGLFTSEPWTWILIGFIVSFHRFSEQELYNISSLSIK